MNKEEFIQKFKDSPKPTSPDKALPFLLQHIQEAHKNNISFTRDEIISISELLCEDLPPEEVQQVKKAMKILKL